jgi:hypothetical protein
VTAHIESPAGAADWRRLNTLLARALELEPTERESWLQGLTGEDTTFTTRLRRLLARAGVEADAFMRRPAAARWSAA